METALIAASVSAIGWLAIYFLTKRREQESRRSQAALRHLERQIEELFGPLEGLLTFSGIVYQIEQERKPLRPPHLADKDAEVINYFVETYYIPLNQEIIKLVRTKLYLLNDNELPKNYQQFLRHAAALESLHILWRKAGIDSGLIPGYEFPKEFRESVRQTLHELRCKYQRLIRDVTQYDGTQQVVHSQTPKV